MESTLVGRHEELARIAAAVHGAGSGQPRVVSVDTTRVDAELSNIVISISNLARAMPTNLPTTNGVRVELRNTGFFLHLGRNEVKVK